MAFTAAQKTLIHELLEVFEGATFDWFDYNDWVTGEITSVPLNQQMDFSKATDRLAAIFVLVEAASDNREIRIGEILDEYDAVSLDQVTIGPGGTSSAGGVRYSTDRHRAHLRSLLQVQLGIRVRLLNERRGGRSIMVSR